MGGISRLGDTLTGRWYETDTIDILWGVADLRWGCCKPRTYIIDTRVAQTFGVIISLDRQMELHCWQCEKIQLGKTPWIILGSTSVRPNLIPRALRPWS